MRGMVIERQVTCRTLRWFHRSPGTRRGRFFGPGGGVRSLSEFYFASVRVTTKASNFRHLSGTISGDLWGKCSTLFANEDDARTYLKIP